jgi:hypothetical protein
VTVTHFTACALVGVTLEYPGTGGAAEDAMTTVEMVDGALLAGAVIEGVIAGEWVLMTGELEPAEADAVGVRTGGRVLMTGELEVEFAGAADAAGAEDSESEAGAGAGEEVSAAPPDPLATPTKAFKFVFATGQLFAVISFAPVELRTSFPPRESLNVCLPYAMGTWKACVPALASKVLVVLPEVTLTVPADFKSATTKTAS